MTGWDLDGARRVKSGLRRSSEGLDGAGLIVGRSHGRPLQGVSVGGVHGGAQGPSQRLLFMSRFTRLW